MQRPERMGTEPVLKLIVSFAVPSIAGMLANALYNIVDRIFVGRVVGAEGLAAIGLCFSFMIFNVGLCLLFGVGGATLISIALGENDEERAEKILGTVTAGIFIASLAVAVFCALKLDWILSVSGANETLLPSAREYLRIILLGIPLANMAFTLNFCVRAEGRPTFAMGTQILGALSNIVFDALFIVWGGMGIAGAAWGTIISQGLSALWIASFYVRRAGVVRFKMKNFLPRPSVLGRVLLLGFSSFLTDMSFTLFMVLFNRALSAHGGSLAVSAFGAFMGWDSLLFMPVIGIGEAVQTLFAYNYGARLMGRILGILKWALILASGYFFSSAVSVYFWAGEMLRLFTTDPDLLALAEQGARISYSGVLLVGIALITVSFFQGMGRARVCLFLNLARQTLFLIPAVWFLPRIFGLTGIWHCFPVMDFASGALALCLLLREYKRLGLKEFE
ncbi:MAG: MATE family efflux transporter [Synergistaceae bacterium]|jgi:putative MATE family efflux protein|nr:MATE family efflux transporter [Synergistaceae bacterium]